MAQHRTITLPDGRTVVLVDREQLRVKGHGRRFAVPNHLKALMAELPQPPQAFDWSKGRAIKYPVLGNDKYGCCFYAAAAHGSQTYTGNSDSECVFDQAQLDARYLQISGGDNGLDDQTMLPEWKGGIVGPNGPRKVISTLTVDPHDEASLQLALWACGGGIYTASLLKAWLNDMRPGAVWDAGSPPDVHSGHAMWLSGRNADGTFQDETWGFDPAIRLTKAGMLASDPEVIVAFSQDQFDPTTGLCAFTGMTWEGKRAFWQSIGGRDVGPSPLPVNPPGPPPAPPPVNPPPQPPVPVPPAPAPVPVITLQQVRGYIDQAFALIERSNPYMRGLLELVREDLEAILTRMWPANITLCNPPVRSLPCRQTLSPTFIDAIIGVVDGAFAAAKADNPALAAVLAYVNGMLDGYLRQVLGGL